MNEDTNNIEIEDTDGHAAKFKPEASKVEEADTEGHGRRFPEASKVEEADTEGHMPRIKLPEDQQLDVGEDSEGHAVRVRPDDKGVEEAGTEGEDSEGHAVRGRP